MNGDPFQQLIIPNATLLGYRQASEGFGGDFRFKKTQEMTLRGLILDLSNVDGVQGVTEKIEELRNSVNSREYNNIIVNGINFGRGRITNFSVEEGIHVQRTNYTLSLSIDKEGNLDLVSGNYYNGLDQLNSELTTAKLLKDFNESFSFNRSDNLYSYSHSIGVTFNQGDNVIISPTDRAKAFATELFDSSIPFGFIDQQVSGFYQSIVGKNYYNETYDLINGSCSFEKRFEALNITGSYSTSIENKLTRREDGVVEVEENTQVKGLIEPVEDSMRAGINQELDLSYGRCNEVFGQFAKGQYDNEIDPLINTPISIGKRFNKFNGNGEFSVIYTNDPKINLTYTWEYTHELEKTDANYFVSEIGSIIGIGLPIIPRYENAINGFNAIKGGIEGRVVDFYQNSIGSFNSLYEIEVSQNRNQYRGEIRYSSRYTDDPSFGNPDFRKVIIAVEDSLPVEFINSFNILNFKEIAQSIDIATIGSKSLSIEVLGHRNSDINSMLSNLVPKVNFFAPSSIEPYLSECSYSFDRKNKTIIINITWSYHQNLSTDILIK